jgi:hypothetical protein
MIHLLLRVRLLHKIIVVRHCAEAFGAVVNVCDAGGRPYVNERVEPLVCIQSSKEGEVRKVWLPSVNCC